MCARPQASYRELVQQESLNEHVLIYRLSEWVHSHSGCLSASGVHHFPASFRAFAHAGPSAGSTLPSLCTWGGGIMPFYSLPVTLLLLPLRSFPGSHRLGQTSLFLSPVALWVITPLCV